jgi:DUF1009 family protein
MSQKLGIIAGSGELPKEAIRKSLQKGLDIYVIAFDGITESPTVLNAPHSWVNIGSIGKALKILKDQNIKDLVMVGRVGRPSISSLKLDFSGLKLLRDLSKLNSGGDDKVFSTIISFIEKNGFNVLGVDDVLNELLVEKGVLTKTQPDPAAKRDIELGRKAALEVGKLDIGQAVIIQQGMILGVEAAEGTDKLIKRCKELHNDGAGGVLVKMKKPNQDKRVDLPSIGVNTITNAHFHKLRGVAVEAGSSLIINREEVIKKADELGVFLIGI